MKAVATIMNFNRNIHNHAISIPLAKVPLAERGK